MSREGNSSSRICSSPVRRSSSTPTWTARLSGVLGSAKEANRRTIYQYVRIGRIKSCQLVMGFTELHEGSVWNTFPPHTRDRRTEVYCYFDLPKDGVVVHPLGEGGERG